MVREEATAGAVMVRCVVEATVEGAKLEARVVAARVKVKILEAAEAAESTI
jgi:hypothetical protein